MDLQPKTENGSGPMFGSKRNPKNMSISELVSELRVTFLMADFDRVEGALVAREAKLKAEIEDKMREIGSLQERVEVERMDRISADLELKRVQERYENLLKAVKNGGLDDRNRNTICELRNRNRELEDEKCKLEGLKKKWVLDSDAIAELWARNSELEEEMKKWLDDRDAVDELRIENRRLVDEKREAELLVETWKRKFCELNERVVRLENDTERKLLMNGDARGGGNTEGVSGSDPGLPFVCKVEKEMIEMDVHDRGIGGYTAGSALSQRNEDFHLCFGAGTRKSPGIPSKDGVGASAKGRLGLGAVIEIIEDSEEDECNSQRTLHRKETTSQIIAGNGHPSTSGAVQQKNLPTGVAEPIGILKREFAYSSEFGTINILGGLDIDTSSSSSSGSFDMDRLPLSTSYKKKKTDQAASLGSLNSSPR